MLKIENDLLRFFETVVGSMKAQDFYNKCHDELGAETVDDLRGLTEELLKPLPILKIRVLLKAILSLPEKPVDFLTDVLAEIARKEDFRNRLQELGCIDKDDIAEVTSSDLSGLLSEDVKKFLEKSHITGQLPTFSQETPLEEIVRSFGESRAPLLEKALKDLGCECTADLKEIEESDYVGLLKIPARRFFKILSMLKSATVIPDATSTSTPTATSLNFDPSSTSTPAAVIPDPTSSSTPATVFPDPTSTSTPTATSLNFDPSSTSTSATSFNSNPSKCRECSCELIPGDNVTKKGLKEKLCKTCKATNIPAATSTSKCSKCGCELIPGDNVTKKGLKEKLCKICKAPNIPAATSTSKCSRCGCKLIPGNNVTKKGKLCKTCKASNTPAAPNSIFVGNVSHNTDTVGIRREFEKCGKIAYVRIVTDKSTGKSKGFAFVQFVYAEDVQKALKMNGTMLDGRALKIEINIHRQTNSTKEKREKYDSGKAPDTKKPNRASTKEKREKYDSGKAPDRKKPNRAVELDHILKYVTSRKGTILTVLDRVRYEDKIYHINQNHDTVLCQVSSKTINAKFIYCCDKGVICYDPFKMYDVNEKLFITHELDLSPKSVPVELEIPYVPEATKYLFQGTTVIFFVPYKVSLDKEYYKSVVVYRTAKRNDYLYIFAKDYTREDFHITCACSTIDYLVVSRLPFSENELRIEMEKTKQYYEYLRIADENEMRNNQLLAQLNEHSLALKNTIQKLIYTQQALETQRLLEEQRRAEENRRKAVEERERAEEERKRREEQRRLELSQRLEREARLAADWRRARDPVDFFVWDYDKKTYEMVIEYHKDADQAYFLGKNRLFLVKHGGTHEFEMVLSPADLHNFKGYPLRPEKLSPLF